MSNNSDEEWLVPEEFDIVVEEPYERGNSKRYATVAAITFALILGFAIRVVPFPQTETRNDGTQVVDLWASFSHYAIGKDAISRIVKFTDGKIESGPLKMGLRHGSWTRTEDGVTAYDLYVLGKLR